MRHLLRPAAAVLAGLLTVTLVQAPASAAPADQSATWLSHQLTDGLVVGSYQDTWTDPDNPTWVEYTDHGLTADTAYALQAIGGHDDELRAIRKALASQVDVWTTYRKNVYAGSVAKAVVVAQVTGANPRRFGGVNLVKRLNARVSDKDRLRGRVQDKASIDYVNTVGQAFAARGLARAGSGKAPSVVAYLLKQQCSEGFFRLNFAAKTADRQGCDAGRPKLSSPDTDATALALLNLLALPKSARTKAVRRALNNGIAWMKDAQREDGSYGGGTATEASNSNSTGLAAWVLGDAGACRKAQAAATWVATLQVPEDVTGTPLEGEAGAIAYDQAAYDAGAADGIGVAEQDQWRRTTTQAAPGLRYLSCS